MKEHDDIRPRGTVEIRCSHPECGVCTWVDPLDPRVLGGYTCGRNHERAKAIDRLGAEIEARFGLTHMGYGALRNQDGSWPCVACFDVHERGYLTLHAADGSVGCYTWHTMPDWTDPRLADVIVAGLCFDPALWPEEEHIFFFPDNCLFEPSARAERAATMLNAPGGALLRALPQVDGPGPFGVWLHAWILGALVDRIGPDEASVPPWPEAIELVTRARATLRHG